MASIKSLARVLKVDDNVIFTGRVERRKVRDYISAADIGISYVPINESFSYNPPLKTFEYLACGLPTIATATESNRRIIDDGFNGILTSDNPEYLADAIINLLMIVENKSL